MFYLKRAVEAAGVLALIGVVVLQLPAGAALAAMAYVVWAVWFVIRIFHWHHASEHDAVQSNQPTDSAAHHLPAKTCT